MIDLKPLFDFFTSSSRKTITKIFFGVSAIIGFLLVDDILKFSYSFRTSRKVEIVQSINTLLNDTLLDSSAKTELKILMSRVIAKEPFYVHLLSSLVNIEFANSSSIQSANASAASPIISIYSDLLSSTWWILVNFLLFVALMVVFLEGGLIEKIAVGTVILIIGLFIIYLYFLAIRPFLPVFQTSWINLGVLFIIQSLISGGAWIGLVSWANKQKT
ncbi:MAG: hypothetical protein LCH37_14855 [Bacteroidetes bacterium]|nr:hypothetical protein [Bacteroidota bacterium]